MCAERIQSSFRDPIGHVFTREGTILRQVNLAYQEQYDHLVSSGLYDELVNSGVLVPHEELELESSDALGVYKILKPEQVPFISYPYEWSFSQLKDAALTTLAIQKITLDFGMTLKDSSAFNIQFFRGRPLLIDTLSFEKLREGEPWAAYRQFCQHFLAPLALIRYKHVGAGQLSRNYIDGVPLDLASALLPNRSHIKPSMQMHIHLHSRLQSRFADKPDANVKRKGTFSLSAFRGLVDSLESAVSKLRWRAGSTEWTGYYDGDSYSPEAMTDKIETVDGFLREVEPKSVWDLGANTGLFSRLASDRGIETVSFDQDPAAVESNYLTTVSQKETNHLPLVLDLTNPSPRIGWANRERMDLVDRGPVDMLFALALIHHIAIGNNVPLILVAEYFRSLSTWVIVEFVPKSDKQVARLLATREDVFPTYNEEHFEAQFERYFEIKSKHKINSSDRTLYLLRGK